MWRDFLSDDTAFVAAGADPYAVTNILFSSGTTGDPKAIPWTHLTPIKAAMDGHFHQDIRPGDVVAWPTNIGWMMGPWLIYATLINRACIALYEGLPSGRGFTDFVHRAGVSMLGVVPSLVRAWKDSGACDGIDWSMIRTFSSTGEPSNRRDSLWLMSRTGYRAPVIEYCGGTEIGGAYLSGTVLQEAIPATFTTPTLGIDVRVLDEEGTATDTGELYLVPPSIGLSQTLLNRNHDEVYYQGVPEADVPLRRHGDHIQQLPNGYFRALGRVDDAMNLSGIKVSSAEIERAIDSVDGVAESAAIAVSPPGGGPSRLVVYAVPSDPAVVDVGRWKAEMQAAIGSRLNSLFKVSDVVAIDELPRTASAKVMRRTLRDSYR
jgi:acetyl-CoA synthetase